MLPPPPPKQQVFKATRSHQVVNRHWQTEASAGADKVKPNPEVVSPQIFEA